jgi:hypothetical protein
MDAGGSTVKKEVVLLCVSVRRLRSVFVRVRWFSGTMVQSDFPTVPRSLR